jgi:hypothetical protein
MHFYEMQRTNGEEIAEKIVQLSNLMRLLEKVL